MRSRGSFYDLFFFSVETSSTVGYGDMHPQTFYGHVVATGEGFIAVVLIAMMTGLTFARFSRPRARLIFARHPVVADHEGQPTLIFRLANARNAFISEATAKLWMLGATVSKEGRRFVGFQPLRLTRNENPALGAELDAVSPDRTRQPALRRRDGRARRQRDQFRPRHLRLRRHVGPVGAHARNTFAARDVRPGHEFVDIHSLDENGMRRINYARIHDTRPVRIAAPAEPSREARVT